MITNELIICTASLTIFIWGMLARRFGAASVLMMLSLTIGICLSGNDSAFPYGCVIAILLFVTLIVLHGKTTGKKSPFYRYSPYNPNSMLPPKLRLALLILGTITALTTILSLFVSLSCVSAQAKLLLPICNNNGRWGYCDENGVVAITFLYCAAYTFENGVAEVYDDDWSRLYIDERGKTATRKKGLPSYVPPAITREKTDGGYRLIHRDGRVVDFPEFKSLYIWPDGCATGVTKDHRGCFSRDPMNVNSWKCFSRGTDCVWYYDEQSKIISYEEKDTSILRYWSVAGLEVRRLEESVKKYDWYGVCARGRVAVSRGKESATRYGVLSYDGNVILPCEYDDVEASSPDPSPFILAWKYGNERKHSVVSVFDDSGLKTLSLTVDGDHRTGIIPSEGWYRFVIGGTDYWVSVRGKKKLHTEGEKVVVEQIK